MTVWHALQAIAGAYLSAIGGTSYQWNNLITQNVPFNVYTTRTYTVIAYDTNGCNTTNTTFNEENDYG